MPFPLLGLLGGAAARTGIAAIGKKVAGRALRFLTKGRLIGQGGGAIAARRLGGLALGAGTAVEVGRQVRDVVNQRRRPYTDPSTGIEGTERIGRIYRRMNPMNVRALRRSVRRIHSAEKLFRKVFTITKGQVNVRKARRSS